MMSDVVISETTAADDDFVALFDRYRVHYGQPADPDSSRDWLAAATTIGPMRAFLARVGGAAAGICLVAVCPASLTLGEFWMIRDLYVEPRWRRTGVAPGLLDAVRAAAQHRGALRLSLQTEEDNADALRLYDL